MDPKNELDEFGVPGPIGTQITKEEMNIFISKYGKHIFRLEAIIDGTAVGLDRKTLECFDASLLGLLVRIRKHIVQLGTVKN